MRGVGGHQSLLDRENEVVSRMEGGRGYGRIAPAQPELQRVDRFAQSRWRVGLVLKTEHLDVIEQDVRFGEQGLPASLNGGF